MGSRQLAVVRRARDLIAGLQSLSPEARILMLRSIQADIDKLIAAGEEAPRLPIEECTAAALQGARSVEFVVVKAESGSLRYSARPDFIVAPKPSCGGVAIPAGTRIWHVGDLFILAEDQVLQLDCEFGDPNDGSTFGCDGVPVKLPAGALLEPNRPEVMQQSYTQAA